MKERPILFSAPMVRAILDGTKMQTRRIIKHQPGPGEVGTLGFGMPFIRTSNGDKVLRCPYGQPGDRLWVRETFQPIYPQDPLYNCGKPICYDYAATYRHGDRLGDAIGEKKKWKPSIHMPRWASRITLEVTGVRVERLQDISEKDAIAEGCDNSKSDAAIEAGWYEKPRAAYRRLWEQINGAGSWEANPWVWVIEFEVVK